MDDPLPGLNLAVPSCEMPQWNAIHAACSDDHLFMASLVHRLKWSDGTLCGVPFMDLREVDMRRTTGRRLKCVLEVTAHAHDTPPCRSIAAQTRRRRKTLREVGRLLYQVGRGRFIREDARGSMAASCIASACQTWWRNAVRRRQGICTFVPGMATNQQDCVTLSDVASIPTRFFVSLPSINAMGKRYHYAFDVRSLWYMMQQGSVHPYTNEPFTAADQSRVNLRIQVLQAMGVSCQHEEDHAESASTATVVSQQLPPQQQQQQQQKKRVVTLCQQLDKLVALTNVDWILSLTTPLLYEWWLHVEDIINWRSELQASVRAKVMPNPHLFNAASKHALQHLSNHDRVFDFVIAQMESLLREAVDDEHRALGAMYVMTGLCCCSEAARCTLPWLYQPPSAT